MGCPASVDAATHYHTEQDIHVFHASQTATHSRATVPEYAVASRHLLRYLWQEGLPV